LFDDQFHLDAKSHESEQFEKRTRLSGFEMKIFPTMEEKNIRGDFAVVGREQISSIASQIKTGKASYVDVLRCTHTNQSTMCTSNICRAKI
jgi:hypothetical protein